MTNVTATHAPTRLEQSIELLENAAREKRARMLNEFRRKLAQREQRDVCDADSQSAHLASFPLPCLV